MPKQTVFRFPKRTAIEDLTVHEEEIQKPLSQEVLIRIHSVALNYRDYAIATSKYPFSVKDDVVPCSDLCGEVEAFGSQVEEFRQGDKVIASFDLATQYGTIENWEHGLGGPTDGVLRQFIALPKNVVIKVPQTTSLSYSQLSSLVCTGTTAWNALYGNLPLKPGQVVLFLGKTKPPSLLAQNPLSLTAPRYRWRLDHRPYSGQGRGRCNYHHLLVRRQAPPRPEDLWRRPRH